MTKLSIAPGLTIDDSDLEERFTLSSGPGGQNVNKVATAVELRFDAAHSASLSEEAKHRLRALAGRRMSKDGVLVLHGRRFRDQLRNREDVRKRLFDLLRRAVIPPRKRKPTKPTRAAKEKRLEDKKARSSLKRTRTAVDYSA